jgi:hypothetical protein
MKSPDEICSSAYDKGVRFTIQTSDEEYILIEGTKEALEFLGNLIIAQAENHDCGFQLSPKGAGKALFVEGSETGLYIHRIPCDHKASEESKNT